MKTIKLTPTITVAATLLTASLGAQTKVTPAAHAPYEIPAVLRASNLLKPEVIRGAHHVILEPVPTAGFANQYTVRTNWGTHTIRGNDLLAKRLNELNAIARLEQASKSEEFEKALRSAAAKPFNMAGKALQDPVGAAKKLGSGAVRFIRRAGEAVERGGKKSANTDNSAKALIGFSAQKRKIAYELKVDPYTDNAVLQQRLDDMAWASFGGGFIIKATTFAVGGAVGSIASGLGTADDISKSILDNNPTDLSGINRASLTKMGIDAALIKAFLEHPHISPTNQTIITTKLHNLGQAGGRDAFLKMVLSSSDTADVLFFQRTAELMENYHLKVSPIKQVLNLHGLPAIHAHDDALVIPLSVDYGWWSAECDRLSAAIANYKPAVTISKRILYITGRISPLARKQLTARGFIISENANAWLYK